MGGDVTDVDEPTPVVQDDEDVPQDAQPALLLDDALHAAAGERLIRDRKPSLEDRLGGRR